MQTFCKVRNSYHTDIRGKSLIPSHPELLVAISKGRTRRTCFLEDAIKGISCRNFSHFYHPKLREQGRDPSDERRGLIEWPDRAKNMLWLYPSSRPLFYKRIFSLPEVEDEEEATIDLPLVTLDLTYVS